MAARGGQRHDGRGATAPCSRTLLPLGGGHFAAMASCWRRSPWLSWYVDWSRAIRFGAGALVLLFGVYKLIQRRHPRALARIPPTQLAWWSLPDGHRAWGRADAGAVHAGAVRRRAGGSPARRRVRRSGHATVMNYLAQSTRHGRAGRGGAHAGDDAGRPGHGLGRLSLPRPAFPAPRLAQPRRRLGCQPGRAGAAGLATAV